VISWKCLLSFSVSISGASIEAFFRFPSALQLKAMDRVGVANHTPTHTPSHATPTHDISNYCTLSRKTSKKSQKKKTVLDRKHSGSSEDLYTGTKVSKVPEAHDYTVKVWTPSLSFLSSPPS
jgi:hypothetical protein